MTVPTADQVTALCARLQQNVTDFQELVAVLRSLLAELEQERRRYAEGLEAWRANNLWHAGRIRELEDQVTRLGGVPCTTH